MTKTEEIKELNKIELELIKQNEQNSLPLELFLSHQIKRAEILQHYGLPDSTDYSKILEFGKRKLTQKEIKDTINTLHNAAKEYLLRPVLTDKQKLKNAQEQKKSPYQILPELGIKVHTYTTFVYNEFLLENRDTVENILKTLQLANRKDILTNLGNIANGDRATPSEKIKELQNIGILYLDEFKKYISQEVYNTVNELLHALTPNHSINNLEAKFDEIAYYLMNYTVLNIDLKPYRITELEIYYHHAKFHADPYVYKHHYQLANSQWCFHRSGLNITFGDDESICAGVLIRGIKDLEQDRYIDGPLKVVGEIFNCFGYITDSRHYFHLVQYEPQESEEEPTKSTRVGLKQKREDKDNYKDKLYRYLVEINSKHKFQGKTIVAKQLLKTGQFSKDEINKKFGYKIV